MTTVDTSDGLAYGLRTAAVFALVAAVAAVVMSIGADMMVGARTVGYLGERSTDWPQLIAGGAVTLAGGVALSAGAVGLLYKIVADAVRRGSEQPR